MLGNYASNPLLLVGCVLVSAWCARWFGRELKVGVSWLFVLVFQISLVVCVSCSVRFVYYFQGKATVEHVIVSAIATGIGISCIAACFWYAGHVNKLRDGSAGRANEST